MNCKTTTTTTTTAATTTTITLFEQYIFSSDQSSLGVVSAP